MCVRAGRSLVMRPAAGPSAAQASLLAAVALFGHAVGRVQQPPSPTATHTDPGEAAVQYCRSHNTILPRHDGQYGNFPSSVPYSVPKYPVPLSAANGRSCKTVAQLLDAVASGSRMHLYNDTAPLGRLAPSVFTPLGCGVGHHSRAAMQRTLGSYQFLAVIGDSHSRHHYQGLQLLHSEDLRTGAMNERSRTRVRKIADKNVPVCKSSRQCPHVCECDGQFAEDVGCRNADKGRPIKYEPNNSTAANFVLHSHLLWMRRGDGPSYLECAGGRSRHGKPMAFLLQGGPHHHFHVNKTYGIFIEPALRHIRYKEWACGAPAVVFVTGVHAQDPVLDAKYPHQMVHHGRLFNIRMRALLAKEHPDVGFVDFLPLTRGAQSSDGFHYLSDVNIAKAEILLSLMDLRLQELASTNSRIVVPETVDPAPTPVAASAQVEAAPGGKTKRKSARRARGG